MKFGIRLFLIILFAFFQHAAALGQEQMKAIFDLSNHEFTEDEFVRISGNWEFYYDQLLEPGDFDNQLPTDYINVPGSWSRQGEYDILGIATYRCITILPADHPALILHIGMINSSSRIWVNGTEQPGTGKVATSKDEYQPQLNNINISLPNDSDTIEIVIQAANYSYFSSGIVGHPTIGTSASLIKKKNEANGVENFFAGSLIAMFVYQLMLFFLYKQGKPNLWLAIICLVAALRSMILNGGSFLLPNLFPDIPFEVWKKIEFGGVYLIVAVFPLYIHHLFQASSSKKAINFFIVLAGILVISVIVTPQHVYGQLLDVGHVGLLLSFIYAIYTVTRAWIRDNPDAKIIFFGVVASFPFILMEILKNSFLIRFNIKIDYLVELGVIVFLLFQAYILALHYAKSYKSLEQLNIELENEIAIRTSELVDSNKTKEKLLSVISHDVKSPLNSLQALISLYNSKGLSKEEFENYLTLLESDLETTTGLVENILYWTANQRKGVAVKIEKINISELIKDNVDHLSGILRSKSITINHDISDKFTIRSDKGIVNFVIRNLIANAIKFSNDGGEIKVEMIKSSSEISLRVIDNGVGMAEIQMTKLFQSDINESTQGTGKEFGTGLGLTLGREYLHQVGGELSVESQKDVGSTFIVTLPLN